MPVTKHYSIISWTILLVLLAFNLTFAEFLSAHPHAFVTTHFKVIFDDNGVKGIRVNWVFDEMYSSMTGPEFDLDGDGTFDEKESEQLILLGNESLPDLNYYTHIEVDGKPHHVQEVENFSITYENGILEYEFFVPCRILGGSKKHQLKISPYDVDLFLAMLLPEIGAVLLENDDSFDVELSIAEDPDTLIYFDMIHPIALNLQFERKP